MDGTGPRVTRAFLKGAAFGAVATFVLIWLFPVLAPVAHETSSEGHEDLPTLDRMRARGTARIGFANEAPYAYLDPESGRLTGEAPEVARVILGGLGIDRVEGVLTEFGALIPGLRAGRFDLVAAGMYVTPERCREAAFSNPTYGIGEALVVRAGNPLGLHAYADIAAHESATLGVVTGAIERRYALASDIPEARIAVFPDAPSALEAVSAGRVDAYGGTSLTVRDLLAKADDPRLERAQPFTDPIVDGRTVRGYGAFVFRRADEALRVAFDRALADFVGTEAHLALVAPFGFARENLPGDVTADALCRPVTAED
jgi:polar amino acid transport system substrate-binding protein